MNRIEAVK